MTQTYPLTVTRNRGWYGKVRDLQIYVLTPRGKWRLGAVKQGQSVEVQVPQDAERPQLTLWVNYSGALKRLCRFSSWKIGPPDRFICVMPCKFESVPR